MFKKKNRSRKQPRSAESIIAIEIERKGRPSRSTSLSEDNVSAGSDLEMSFDVMVSELGLNPVQESALRQLPLQQKAILLEEHRSSKEQGETRHDHVVDMDAVVGGDVVACQHFVQYLKTAPLADVRQLIAHGGMQAIITGVDACVRSGMRSGKDHLVLRLLLHALMQAVNVQEGLDVIANDSRAVYLVMSVLNTRDQQACQAAIEVLTFLMVTGAHQLVYGLLTSVVKQPARDAKVSRLSFLKSKLQDADSNAFKCALLTFLNVCICAPQDLTTRMRIRGEVMDAGVPEVVRAVVGESGCPRVAEQWELWLAAMEQDQQELAASSPTGSVDLSNVEEVALALARHGKQSQWASSQLACLQQLWNIRNDVAVGDSVWVLMEQLVAQMSTEWKHVGLGAAPEQRVVSVRWHKRGGGGRERSLSSASATSGSDRTSKRSEVEVGVLKQALKETTLALKRSEAMQAQQARLISELSKVAAEREPAATIALHTRPKVYGTAPAAISPALSPRSTSPRPTPAPPTSRRSGSVDGSHLRIASPLESSIASMLPRAVARLQRVDADQDTGPVEPPGRAAPRLPVAPKPKAHAEQPVKTTHQGSSSTGATPTTPTTPAPTPTDGPEEDLAAQLQLVRKAHRRLKREFAKAQQDASMVDQLRDRVQQLQAENDALKQGQSVAATTVSTSTSTPTLTPTSTPTPTPTAQPSPAAPIQRQPPVLVVSPAPVVAAASPAAPASRASNATCDASVPSATLPLPLPVCWKSIEGQAAEDTFWYKVRDAASKLRDTVDTLKTQLDASFASVPLSVDVNPAMVRRIVSGQIGDGKRATTSFTLTPWTEDDTSRVALVDVDPALVVSAMKDADLDALTPYVGELAQAFPIDFNHETSDTDAMSLPVLTQLAEDPHVVAKVCFIQLQQSFHECINSLLPDVSALLEASRSLKASRMFQWILRLLLPLGNHLNGDAASVPGFDLHSMALLDHVVNANGQTFVQAMHSLAVPLQPKTRNLASVLQCVSHAANVNVHVLRDRVTLVASQVDLVTQTQWQSECWNTAVQAFLAQSAWIVPKMAQALRDMEVEFQKMCTFYGMDGTTTESVALFGAIDSFLQAWDRASSSMSGLQRQGSQLMAARVSAMFRERRLTKEFRESD